MTLTREQIEAMEAGRELDLAVAEHVMGWRGESVVLPYSTDIAAAWRVMEAILARPTERYLFGLSRDYVRHDDLWVASFCVGPDDGEAKTAPLAICRAALLAVLHEQAREAQRAGDGNA